MRRREFITALCGAAAWPLAAGAQPVAGRAPRIGFIQANPGENVTAFMQGLRDAGYIDGQTATIETRHYVTAPERLDDIARELVALKCDVIFAAAPYAIQAALRATSAIPIVGIDLESDPVASGWARNLARPGGNLTGLSLLAPSLVPKRLELLKEVATQVSRLAVLADARALALERQWDEIRGAAAALGLEPRRYDVRSPEDFGGAFSAMTGDGAGALVALPSPAFNRSRTRIVALAAQARLPAMYEQRLFTDAGGLMSYGPNLPDLYRRAATYVDRILKGARPADLPVEQPTTFDFVINLKTAQALRLAIPESVLAQATDVIQ